MQISEEDRRRRKGKIVLSIEDDPVTSAYIQAALEEAGFSVMVARTGEEGLTLLSRIAPALILMDVNLPGDNGYRICAEARRRYPDLRAPVLFLTARRTADDVQAARQVGGAQFLVKPLTPDKLVDRVVQALATRPWRPAVPQADRD
jgi:DNA-binding response OmpR family regulator